MLRFGPDSSVSGGPVAVMALPLFEEANRVRTFAVTLCRALAARGVASVLPDLPGQSESLASLEEVTLLHMREAMAAVADVTRGRAYAVGLRSGALLDPFGLFHGRWHLAPVDGATLLRDLLRIAQASAAVPPRSDVYTLIGAGNPVLIAGSPLTSAMAADLQGAILCDDPAVPRRTVRLDTDARPADRHVPGVPLWRRAEPDNAPALAALVADDIAGWIARCEG